MLLKSLFVPDSINYFPAEADALSSKVTAGSIILELHGALLA